MNTEQQLVSKIQQGDRTAMRELYNRYSGYAMAVAQRYVPDRDDVQDVLQDSFVKIFTAIGHFRYRGEGTLKAWMARIVANAALDFLRRRNSLQLTRDVPDVPDEPDPDLDGISDEALMRLISQLPAGYRVVLNLFVFERLSHKEIAQRLGIRENTSASQYFHAKKMLGKLINDYMKRQQ